MAALRAVREVVRGCGAEGCAFNLGQAENFRSAEILRGAYFFRGSIFSGADPDCQGGFGRESEPHPVALVSLAPLGAGADPAPKLAFAVSGCSGMMQAERLRVDPPERGAPV